MRIWEWILTHVSVERISLVVAIIALVVSVLSTRHARRSTEAAIRSARAAEAQSDIAQGQLHEAQQATSIAMYTAKESQRVAELANIENARSRIDARTGDIFVGLESTEWLPVVREFSIDEPFPHPPQSRLEGDVILDAWNHLSHKVYLVVRGILSNEGDRSVRVLPVGPRFIVDSSELVDNKQMPIPPTIYTPDRCYLFRPGTTAVFEWRAGHILDKWIEYHDRDSSISLPEGDFIVTPAGMDEYTYTISLALNDSIVRPTHGDENRWIVPNITCLLCMLATT